MAPGWQAVTDCCSSEGQSPGGEMSNISELSVSTQKLLKLGCLSSGEQEHLGFIWLNNGVKMETPLRWPPTSPCGAIRLAVSGGSHAGLALDL